MKISVKIVLLFCSLCFLIVPTFTAVIFTFSPFAVKSVHEAGFQLSQEFVSYTAGSLSSVLQSTSISIQGAANDTLSVGSPFASGAGMNETLHFLVHHALVLPHQHDKVRIAQLICRYNDQSAATVQRFRQLVKVEIYQASNAVHKYGDYRNHTAEVFDTPENASLEFHNLSSLEATTAAMVLASSPAPPANFTTVSSLNANTFVNGEFWNLSKSLLRLNSLLEDGNIDPFFGSSTNELRGSLNYPIAWMVNNSRNPLLASSPFAFCGSFLPLETIQDVLTLFIDRRNTISTINFAEDSKAFIVDGDLRVVASSEDNGKVYDIISNFSLLSTADQAALIRTNHYNSECIIDEYTDDAACFYNISSHPAFAALKSVMYFAENSSLTPFATAFIASQNTVLDSLTNDGAYQAFTTLVTTSYPGMSLRFYFFVGTDSYNAAVRPAMIKSIIIAAAISLLALSVMFLLIGRALTTVERLATKMSQDPWSATTNYYYEHDEEGYANDNNESQEETNQESGGEENDGIKKTNNNRNSSRQRRRRRQRNNLFLSLEKIENGDGGDEDDDERESDGKNHNINFSSKPQRRFESSKNRVAQLMESNSEDDQGSDAAFNEDDEDSNEEQDEEADEEEAKNDDDKEQEDKEETKEDTPSGSELQQSESGSSFNSSASIPLNAANLSSHLRAESARERRWEKDQRREQRAIDRKKARAAATGEDGATGTEITIPKKITKQTGENLIVNDDDDDGDENNNTKEGGSSAISPKGPNTLLYSADTLDNSSEVGAMHNANEEQKIKNKKKKSNKHKTNNDDDNNNSNDDDDGDYSEAASSNQSGQIFESAAASPGLTNRRNLQLKIETTNFTAEGNHYHNNHSHDDASDEEEDVDEFDIETLDGVLDENIGAQEAALREKQRLHNRAKSSSSGNFKRETPKTGDVAKANATFTNHHLHSLKNRENEQTVGADEKKKKRRRLKQQQQQKPCFVVRWYNSFVKCCTTCWSEFHNLLGNFEEVYLLEMEFVEFRKAIELMRTFVRIPLANNSTYSNKDEEYLRQQHQYHSLIQEGSAEFGSGAAAIPNINSTGAYFGEQEQGYYLMLLKTSRFLSSPVFSAHKSRQTGRSFEDPSPSPVSAEEEQQQQQQEAEGESRIVRQRDAEHRRVSVNSNNIDELFDDANEQAALQELKNRRKGTGLTLAEVAAANIRELLHAGRQQEKERLLLLQQQQQQLLSGSAALTLSGTSGTSEGGNQIVPRSQARGAANTSRQQQQQQQQPQVPVRRQGVSGGGLLDDYKNTSLPLLPHHHHRQVSSSPLGNIASYETSNNNNNNNNNRGDDETRVFDAPSHNNFSKNGISHHDIRSVTPPNGEQFANAGTGNWSGAAAKNNTNTTPSSGPSSGSNQGVSSIMVEPVKASISFGNSNINNVPTMNSKNNNHDESNTKRNTIPPPPYVNANWMTSGAAPSDPQHADQTSIFPSSHFPRDQQFATPQQLPGHKSQKNNLTNGEGPSLLGDAAAAKRRDEDQNKVNHPEECLAMNSGEGNDNINNNNNNQGVAVSSVKTGAGIGEESDSVESTHFQNNNNNFLNSNNNFLSPMSALSPRKRKKSIASKFLNGVEDEKTLDMTNSTFPSVDDGSKQRSDKIGRNMMKPGSFGDLVRKRNKDNDNDEDDDQEYRDDVGGENQQRPHRRQAALVQIYGASVAYLGPPPVPPPAANLARDEASSTTTSSQPQGEQQPQQKEQQQQTNQSLVPPPSSAAVSTNPSQKISSVMPLLGQEKDDQHSNNNINIFGSGGVQQQQQQQLQQQQQEHHHHNTLRSYPDVGGGGSNGSAGTITNSGPLSMIGGARGGGAEASSKSRLMTPPPLDADIGEHRHHQQRQVISYYSQDGNNTNSNHSHNNNNTRKSKSSNVGDAASQRGQNPLLQALPLAQLVSMNDAVNALVSECENDQNRPLQQRQVSLLSNANPHPNLNAPSPVIIVSSHQATNDRQDVPATFGDEMDEGDVLNSYDANQQEQSTQDDDDSKHQKTKNNNNNNNSDDQVSVGAFLLSGMNISLKQQQMQQQQQQRRLQQQGINNNNYNNVLLGGSFHSPQLVSCGSYSQLLAASNMVPLKSALKKKNANNINNNNNANNSVNTHPITMNQQQQQQMHGAQTNLSNNNNNNAASPTVKIFRHSAPAIQVNGTNTKNITGSGKGKMNNNNNNNSINNSANNNNFTKNEFDTKTNSNCDVDEEETDISLYDKKSDSMNSNNNNNNNGSKPLFSVFNASSIQDQSPQQFQTGANNNNNKNAAPNFLAIVPNAVNTSNTMNATMNSVRRVTFHTSVNNANNVFKSINWNHNTNNNSLAPTVVVGDTNQNFKDVGRSPTSGHLSVSSSNQNNNSRSPVSIPRPLIREIIQRQLFCFCYVEFLHYHLTYAVNSASSVSFTASMKGRASLSTEQQQNTNHNDNKAVGNSQCASPSPSSPTTASHDFMNDDRGGDESGSKPPRSRGSGGGGLDSNTATYSSNGADRRANGTLAATDESEFFVLNASSATAKFHDQHQQFTSPSLHPQNNTSSLVPSIMSLGTSYQNNNNNNPNSSKSSFALISPPGAKENLRVGDVVTTPTRDHRPQRKQASDKNGYNTSPSDRKKNDSDSNCKPASDTYPGTPLSNHSDDEKSSNANQDSHFHRRSQDDEDDDEDEQHFLLEGESIIDSQNQNQNQSANQHHHESRFGAHRGTPVAPELDDLSNNNNNNKKNNNNKYSCDERTSPLIQLHQNPDLIARRLPNPPASASVAFFDPKIQYSENLSPSQTMTTTTTGIQPSESELMQQLQQSPQPPQYKVTREDKELFYFRRRVSEVSAALLAVSGLTLIEFFGDSMLGCFRLKSNFAQSTMVTRLCQSLIKLQTRELKAHNKRVAQSKKRLAALRNTKRTASSSFKASGSPKQKSDELLLFNVPQQQQQQQQQQNGYLFGASMLQSINNNNNNNNNNINVRNRIQRSPSIPPFSAINAAAAASSSSMNHVALPQFPSLLGNSNSNNNIRRKPPNGANSEKNSVFGPEEEAEEMKNWKGTSNEANENYDEEDDIDDVEDFLVTNATATSTTFDDGQQHQQRQQKQRQAGPNKLLMMNDDTNSIADSMASASGFTSFFVSKPNQKQQGKNGNNNKNNHNLRMFGRRQSQRVNSSAAASSLLMTSASVTNNMNNNNNNNNNSNNNNNQESNNRINSSLQITKLKTVSCVRIFAGIASFNTRVFVDDVMENYAVTTDISNNAAAARNNTNDNAHHLQLLASAAAAKIENDTNSSEKLLFSPKTNTSMEGSSSMMQKHSLSAGGDSINRNHRFHHDDNNNNSGLPTRPLTFFSLGIEHARAVCLAGKQYVESIDARIIKSERRHGRIPLDELMELEQRKKEESIEEKEKGKLNQAGDRYGAEDQEEQKNQSVSVIRGLYHNSNSNNLHHQRLHRPNLFGFGGTGAGGPASSMIRASTTTTVVVRSGSQLALPSLHKGFKNNNHHLASPITDAKRASQQEPMGMDDIFGDEVANHDVDSRINLHHSSASAGKVVEQRSGSSSTSNSTSQQKKSAFVVAGENAAMVVGSSKFKNNSNNATDPSSRSYFVPVTETEKKTTAEKQKNINIPSLVADIDVDADDLIMGFASPTKESQQNRFAQSDGKGKTGDSEQKHKQPSHDNDSGDDDQHDDDQDYEKNNRTMEEEAEPGQMMGSTDDVFNDPRFKRAVKNNNNKNSKSSELGNKKKQQQQQQSATTSPRSNTPPKEVLPNQVVADNNDHESNEKERHKQSNNNNDDDDLDFFTGLVDLGKKSGNTTAALQNKDKKGIQQEVEKETEKQIKDEIRNSASDGEKQKSSSPTDETKHDENILAEIDKQKKRRLVNIFIPNTLSNLLPLHWKYHRCGGVELRKEDLHLTQQDFESHRVLQQQQRQRNVSANSKGYLFGNKNNNTSYNEDSAPSNNNNNNNTSTHVESGADAGNEILPLMSWAEKRKEKMKERQLRRLVKNKENNNNAENNNISDGGASPSETTSQELGSAGRRSAEKAAAAASIRRRKLLDEERKKDSKKYKMQKEKVQLIRVEVVVNEKDDD